MEARLGISQEALQAIIESWPDVDDEDRNSNGYLAINNSLNEICHALAVDEWSSLVDATPDEVKDVYRNWLRLQDIHGGIR